MILFKNNSTARLGAAALAAATTIHLGAGQGALFPTITSGSGDYYFITIVHPVNETYEIVKVVQALGDSLIVTRAQQDTLARDYPINSLVELRWTAKFAQDVVNYVPPRASETVYGTVRLATNSELENGMGDGVVTAEKAGSTFKDKDIVGTIIIYPSNAIPTGYLLCNGASVLKTSYPKLFAVIGTTFGGAGDNFNLPDLRGKFIRGLGGNAATLGTSQNDTVRGYDLSFTLRVYGHANAEGGGAFYQGGGPYNAGGRSSNAMAGYGNYVNYGPSSAISSAETRPVNMGMNYCIKY